MPKRIGLEFPRDPSGQWEGFNQSGIEHFAGRPVIALGRELLQNCLDASLSDDAPVKVKIDTVDINSSDLPNLDEFRKEFALCEKALAGESPKAASFFSAARELLEKPKIKVLRVADFNTTGLRGPCEIGRPYFALMKAQGVSVKQDEASLGSFGIGKYAPFAVSGLRTVFVSTVWSDGASYHHYCQGKVVLGSRREKDGSTRRGTGFWGQTEHCLPVEGFGAVPKWLQRCSKVAAAEQNIGTTVFVLGFRPVKHWQSALAGAIVENFFGAIERGKLEVDIGDIVINKDTLRQILTQENVRSATLELTDDSEDFDNAQLFLEALSSSEGVIVKEHENQHLGLCELRLLVREGLPRRVACLRDGMFITDELPKLKRFGDFKEFVAVVECKAKKGNSLLKAMEPPAHDAFEPDRLPEEQRRAGRVALNDLAKWVRDEIADQARHKPTEVTNVDELRDFFADDLEGSESSGDQEEDPAGRLKIQARPSKRPRPRPGITDEDSDGSGEQDGSDGGQGGGGGSNEGGGGGGTGPNGPSPQNSRRLF